jgi:hypothetical protein
MKGSKRGVVKLKILRNRDRSRRLVLSELNLHITLIERSQTLKQFKDCVVTLVG